MKTLLGNPIKTEEGFTIQSVGDIDSLIGKKITTKEDFKVEVEIKSEKEADSITLVNDKGISIDNLIEEVRNNKHKQWLETINIKDQEIIVDNIIRTCGLLLYCKTMDNRYFAINSTDLELFEEVN